MFSFILFMTCQLGYFDPNLTFQTNMSLEPRLRGIPAIQQKISVEAERQGVPVSLALAMAEVETGFKDVKAKRSGARGPLQVHKSALKPNELPRLLLDPEWNLRRGIEILKTYHEKAKGNHQLTRILFVCGYKYKQSCTEPTIQRIKTRWAPVAKKWNLSRNRRSA